MKTLLLALLILLPVSLADADDGRALRLLSYNIHAGIGTDKKFDLERIAAVIKSTKPHVVALQEVDKETQRSRGIDIAKKLGELTGMKHIFGASIPFGGGEYGNAILTTLEIKDTETIAIPEIVAVEQRSVLATNLAFKGSTIQILATHLCHREDRNRVAAAEFIVTRQAPAHTTTFVIGDLNALPESKPLQILAGAGWQNPSKSPVLTFPSAEPKRQIDYVLCRPADSKKIVATEIRVIDEKVASDHRPLLVVFEP
jgi:endonuclease/exonuclease/phosphatase family metal-dependent hydrolase